MFAIFQRHQTRPKIILPDFASLAQFIVRWLSLSKRQAGEPSLQLLESVPLTVQASVALIRFGRETFLLGVTPQNVTVLAKSAPSSTSGEKQTIKDKPLS